jgi:sialate O-acetylesterase
MKPSMLVAAVLLAAASAALQAQPQLPLLFADGAVLQRDQPMPVWGWATPRARIRVGFDGRRADAVADAQGAWQATLPAHAAGGPYLLTVDGDGGTLQVRDVLVGDVWLASGQSNMEWPLAQARDGAQEVAAANDPQLRHFKVPKSWASAPQARLAGGQWAAATPQAAGTFSAVGYFFARDLRRSTGVPIGIIDSSWGGSAIEAWIDAPTQQLDAPKMAAQVAAQQARDRQALDAAHARLARWPAVQGDPQWQAANLDDGDWDTIPVPGLWEAAGYAGMDGVAWYRVGVTLSAAEAKAGITLGVGRIDDGDITYVNGHEVGRTDGRYNDPRAYAVPAGVLHAGRNVVAVRVTDSGGGGGIHGEAGELFVQPVGGQARPIDGAWKFRPAAVTFSLDDDKNQQPTLLYNAMIHPLQRFPVKGVIWYQGETNGGSAASALKYRDQFPALIQSWRGERGQPQLPFLWVQLANYRSGADAGDVSPWALLREAQSMTLALPATGQAVIIDVGNPDNIHPTNKQDVGHRLALAARHVAYGETLAWSAPQVDEVRFDDDQALVAFDLRGNALAVRGGGSEVHGFSVAGSDRVFRPARARIDGGRVVVRSDAVAHPVAVRYGWSDNPADADLVDRAQLPVSPFRTDAW